VRVARNASHVAGIGGLAGGWDQRARELLARELRRELQHQLHQLRELELRELAAELRQLRELELRELELDTLIGVLVELDRERGELAEKLRQLQDRANVGEGGDPQPTIGDGLTRPP
jgi:hypothetical protein